MPMYRVARGSIQHGFSLSRNKLQIFGGGYGNGKTTAMAVKAIKLAVEYPGSNGLLARSTYPKLNDTLRKVFFEWCPPDIIRKRPTQEDNTCYLTNGSTINFRYIAQRGKQNADGSTSSNLLSATYDWIGVDQVEDPEIGHKDLLDLFGRLRGQTPYRPDGPEDRTMPSSGPRWIMLTANPSPNWFYKEIVQPFIRWKGLGIHSEKLLVDEAGIPIIDLFEGSTYTNKQNLPPDYLRGLESAYKGQMRERYLMGKWAAFEGLVYPGFAREVHFVSRAKLMWHLNDLRARHVRVQGIEMLDYGLTSPSCYLFGFINDCGQVFILDGYHKGDFDYRDQIAEVKRIRAKYAHVVNVTTPIRSDPALFKRVVVDRRRETGQTIARLFEDAGIELKPANNDILTGITKVSAYINGHPDFNNPFTDAPHGPLIYFCDELEFIEDEATNYFWKKHNVTGENLDEPIDRNDHAMDAIKYGLADRPDPSAIILPKNTLPPAWMFWRELSDAEEAAERYGDGLPMR